MERLKFLVELEVSHRIIPCKYSALMPLSAAAAIWLDHWYDGMWFTLHHNL